MAWNTIESVWDVGVSKALGWHFICWFPSLYILDYLVPLLKNLGSAHVSDIYTRPTCIKQYIIYIYSYIF